jgi:undecaprenyl-diphosphatase
MKQESSSRLLRFIEARLTPGGELGLHLTVGALLLVVAVAVFGDLAEDVMRREAITVLDQQIAVWFHLRAFEPLTSFMLGVSLMHGGAGSAVLTALLALYLWRRGAYYWLLALLVAVPGGSLLNVLLKYVFQRSRPVFDTPLVSLATYSFPSGHTAAATLLYGVLACYIIIARPRWIAGLGLVAACVAMVLLVALSRVYLGAHFFSDVLAAMVESVGWLAVCISAVSTLRRRRHARASQ